jgi:RNA polymerase sigma-70 factor, ECF subfamily
MSAVEATQGRLEARVAVAAVSGGDESAFGELAESYRPELQRHCSRLLGSVEEAEDLVQENFLRAWRKRRSFQARCSFRRWLYAIATNACLDALERRKRDALARARAQPPLESSWPDRVPVGIATPEAEPEAELVAKETIELTLASAKQLLPPKQRAVLITRSLLGWSAAESAAHLGVSVPAANSALAAGTGDAQVHRSRVPPRAHCGSAARGGARGGPDRRRQRAVTHALALERFPPPFVGVWLPTRRP